MTEKCWRTGQLKLEFIISECMISMQNQTFVMIYSSYFIQDYLEQMTSTQRARSKVLILCSCVHAEILSEAIQGFCISPLPGWYLRPRLTKGSSACPSVSLGCGCVPGWEMAQFPGEAVQSFPAWGVHLWMLEKVVS